MGPKPLVAMGAQTMLNFLIIKTGTVNYKSLVICLCANGEMCCSIGENHMIFCEHLDHRWYHDVKKNHIRRLINDHL